MYAIYIPGKHGIKNETPEEELRLWKILKLEKGKKLAFLKI